MYSSNEYDFGAGAGVDTANQLSLPADFKHKVEALSTVRDVSNLSHTTCTQDFRHLGKRTLGNSSIPMHSPVVTTRNAVKKAVHHS